MKKSLLIILALALWAPVVLADANRQVLSSEYEAVAINSDFRLVPKTEVERDSSLKYSVKAIYPQINGNNLSKEAQQFNGLVMNIVNNEVKQFKNGVKLDVPHLKNLPEEVKNNTFKMDYDIDVIHSNGMELISVRFNIEGMRAGRAHPYHVHQVLNYDLTNGKQLALSDLFKPNSNYLRVFSKYSYKKLNATVQPQDKWMITEGAKAEANNFKNWNIESDAILITFDEYQVAPYLYGPQEVEIPFSVLTSMLSTKAEIIASTKNLNPELG